MKCGEFALQCYDGRCLRAQLFVRGGLDFVDARARGAFEVVDVRTRVAQLLHKGGDFLVLHLRRSGRRCRSRKRAAVLSKRTRCRLLVSEDVQYVECRKSRQRRQTCGAMRDRLVSAECPWVTSAAVDDVGKDSVVYVLWIRMRAMSNEAV